LQRVVRQVARAVAAVVPTERMYSLSLSSRQGNAHLHWHIAPLAHGVPYDQRQYYALMPENGVLEVDDNTQQPSPGRSGKICDHRTNFCFCRSQCGQIA
jgi:diadenosine tetraphosphate (Ap4A) HIT family hydrolase